MVISFIFSFFINFDQPLEVPAAAEGEQAG
jgi:hypothetical protein